MNRVSVRTGRETGAVERRPPRGRIARGRGAIMSQGRDERAVVRAAGDGNGTDPLPDGAVARLAKGRRPINDAAQARIGRGLRLHYADVLALPIPERLRTLIDDLAACSDTEAPQ